MARAKPTEHMIALFDSVVPSGPQVERRKMFGYPAAFTNGNMFCGLHENNLILRLAEADRATLIEKHGAKLFEPMAGRPMREYIVAPLALLSDRPTLQQWTPRSLKHALPLPPKEKAKKSAPPKRPAAKGAGR